MGEFGKKFRKMRESKELSLDAVSNVTKISARMLQAIEEENFDRLPGGVFNKGFIRAYAKHLGLDSEQAVTEYLECLRQEQVDSHDGWDSNTRVDPRAKGAVATKLPVKAKLSVEVEEELPNLQLPRAEHVRTGRKEYLGRSSSGIPRRLIYLVGVIVVAATIFWIRHSRLGQHVAVKSAVSAAMSSPTMPSPVALSSTPASGVSSVASSHPTAPPGRPTAPTHATTPVAANAENTDGSLGNDPSQVKVEKKGDVTIRSFGASPPQPAESAAADLSLIIRASENSWISVTSDGQVVTQETLIAPAHPKFHAARELEVRVGNAAGVSFVWNGEEIAPQGAESEAKTLVFDAQGMHTPTLDQTAH